MFQRYPYRVLGGVFGVFAAALFLAGMIGQFNDGPWGGLPAWLGTAAYATWMVSAIVLLGLLAYLPVAKRRARRGAGR